MPNFEYLKGLDVTNDQVKEYPISEITVNGLVPVLLVASSTEANKPYFNALLKRAGKSARAVRAGKLTAAMLEENREEDKDLYPRFVIRGWTDVLDGDGKALKYSNSDCADFIDALPNWIFDDLRVFCGNPANFADLIDVEVNAKN